MKDIEIYIIPPKFGVAFYVLCSGNIYLSCRSCYPYNIKNVLWHEIMHKILYEENITEIPETTTKQWDSIANDLEDFLFL